MSRYEPFTIYTYRNACTYQQGSTLLRLKKSKYRETYITYANTIQKQSSSELREKVGT